MEVSALLSRFELIRERKGCGAEYGGGGTVEVYFLIFFS